jgi:hypothetical protein
MEGDSTFGQPDHANQRRRQQAEARRGRAGGRWGRVLGRIGGRGGGGVGIGGIGGIGGMLWGWRARCTRGAVGEIEVRGFAVCAARAGVGRAGGTRRGKEVVAVPDGLDEHEQPVEHQGGHRGERQLGGGDTGPGLAVVKLGRTRHSMASVAMVASGPVVPSGW